MSYFGLHLVPKSHLGHYQVAEAIWSPFGHGTCVHLYNDQPLGILALGKIGGGYGSLVFVVSRVCPLLPRNGGKGGCGGWGGLVGGELIVIPFPSV